MQRNIRIKAQLSKTEKEKIDICTIAEEEIIQPKVLQRSTSGIQSRSILQKRINSSQIQSSVSLNLQQKGPMSAAMTKEVYIANLEK